MCAKSSTLTLKGSNGWACEDCHDIYFTFTPCEKANAGGICKSTDLLYKFLDSHFFTVTIRDQYFDYENMDQSVNNKVA